MGMKLVCDICGNEVVVDDGNIGSQPRNFAVMVSTTVHGWFAIWAPRKAVYELLGGRGAKNRALAMPLSGDFIACSPACAEKALAQLNSRQLEAIVRLGSG